MLSVLPTRLTKPSSSACTLLVTFKKHSSKVVSVIAQSVKRYLSLVVSFSILSKTSDLNDIEPSNKCQRSKVQIISDKIKDDVLHLQNDIFLPHLVLRRTRNWLSKQCSRWKHSEHELVELILPLLERQNNHISPKEDDIKEVSKVGSIGQKKN